MTLLGWSSWPTWVVEYSRRIVRSGRVIRCDTYVTRISALKYHSHIVKPTGHRYQTQENYKHKLSQNRSAQSYQSLFVLIDVFCTFFSYSKPHIVDWFIYTHTIVQSGRYRTRLFLLLGRESMSKRYQAGLNLLRASVQPRTQRCPLQYSHSLHSTELGSHLQQITFSWETVRYNQNFWARPN